MYFRGAMLEILKILFRGETGASAVVLLIIAYNIWHLLQTPKTKCERKEIEKAGLYEFSVLVVSLRRFTYQVYLNGGSAFCPARNIGVFS